MKRQMPDWLTALELKKALAAAVAAARMAGRLMRQNLRAVKKINAVAQHDIKLELDVRCQKLIENGLHDAFPQFALLGEEGVAGDPQAPYRWVVDPIDGTVNYAYGIPHACVSIALQGRLEAGPSSPLTADQYQSLLGVVYDPFCEEIWTAICGQPARLNGAMIQVSHHRKLNESIISLGFSKDAVALKKMLPGFRDLVPQVRKIRIMGSAALDLVYVASGRMDAYIEGGVRLWDIAAGGLILECAGGEFWHQGLPGEHYYRVMATNGRLRPTLEKVLGLKNRQ